MWGPHVTRLEPLAQGVGKSEGNMRKAQNTRLRIWSPSVRQWEAIAGARAG